MAPTYDFSITRNQIVRRAFRLAGKLKDNEQMSGDMSIVGAEALESLVKWLQSDNVFLWTLEDRTFTTVASDGEYDLATDLLNVSYVYITDSTGQRFNLPLVTDEAWARISFPLNTGRPTIAMVELRAQPTIKLNPLPDGVYTVGYKATRKMADFDTALGTPETPQRWYDPLCYLLAANLADEYQLPLDKCNYLRQKAESLRATASKIDIDPADALFLNPC